MCSCKDLRFKTYGEISEISMYQFVGINFVNSIITFFFLKTINN